MKIGFMVYIKFGPFHGKKGKVIGTTTDEGLPAFFIKLDGTNDVIIKKQKNTVRMINR
jgi:ribosomal protein L24